MTGRLRWVVATVVAATLIGGCVDDELARTLDATAAAYEAPPGWVAVPPAQNRLDGYDWVHAPYSVGDADLLTGSRRYEPRDPEEIDPDALAASVAALGGDTVVSPGCVPLDVEGRLDPECAWEVDLGDHLVVVHLFGDRYNFDHPGPLTLMLTAVDQEYDFLDTVSPRFWDRPPSG